MASTTINLFGVKLSGKFQVVFGATKVVAVGGIIGITLTGFSTGNIAHFSEPFWPEEFGWPTVLAVGAALRYSFFAFSGWEGATYMAEEVKDRQDATTFTFSRYIWHNGIIPWCQSRLSVSTRCGDHQRK